LFRVQTRCCVSKSVTTACVPTDKRTELWAHSWLLKVAVFCTCVRILALNDCVLNSVGRKGCTFNRTVGSFLCFTSYLCEIPLEVLYMSDTRASKNIYTTQ
jgi:hypothetical protein